MVAFSSLKMRNLGLKIFFESGFSDGNHYLKWQYSISKDSLSLSIKLWYKSFDNSFWFQGVGYDLAVNFCGLHIKKHVFCKLRNLHATTLPGVPKKYSCLKNDQNGEICLLSLFNPIPPWGAIMAPQPNIDIQHLNYKSQNAGNTWLFLKFNALQDSTNFNLIRLVMWPLNALIWRDVVKENT